MLAVLLGAVAIAAVAIVVTSAFGDGGHARPSVAAPAGTSGTSDRRGARHLTGGAPLSPPAAPAAHPRPRPSPPYRVGVASLAVLEPSAVALANAHTPSGAPARSLPTVVRYPAEGRASAASARGLTPARGGGPYPLIVFSQGYDYPAEGYAAVLQAWARAGYVVADPTYPETDPSTPGGPHESDIVNHPRDLRSVISQLLAAARQPSSRLHGLIDPGAIALAGQSDGGDVSLATAANTCCRDPRVRAAVILSGAELAAFGGTYYGSGSPPLLVTQGDADTINVPGCSAGLYDHAPAPKYYLDLLNAPHLPPYVDPGPTRDHVAATVVHFLDRYLRHRAGALTAMRQAATVPGLMTLRSAASLSARGTVCPGAP